MDPYKYLRIERKSDGSLIRHPHDSSLDGTTLAPTVPFRDLPLNAPRKTWLRLYLPTHPHHQKLPILLYVHGGGFILLSASDTLNHRFVTQMANDLPALVISLEYRLAPENPLPAAYDDAVDAILWLKQQAATAEAADEWLRDHGDFSRCFVMGTSAGANIVYHASKRAMALDIRPLNLAGLIFHVPYFGGEKRKESEKLGDDERPIPLPVSDLMWELSLPAGSDRDHEFCNPMLHYGRNNDDQGEERRLPRCLVRGYAGDSLVDWQREFAGMLEKEAVSVVTQLEYEGYHGVEVSDPSKVDELLVDVKHFMDFSVSDGLGSG